MYILVAAAIILGLLNRLFVVLSNRYQLFTRLGMSEKLHTWYKKHIEVSALLGNRHCVPWGWITLPTRLQALFVSGCYSVVSEARSLHMSPSTSFSHLSIMISSSETSSEFSCSKKAESSWPTKQAQLARYVADRTGIMSFYNLPLLFACSGRNDVVLWITGWSYGTLNANHS